MAKFIKNRGFTILELLMVVAMIAIVAAITIVYLNDARERTRRSSNLATLSSMMPEIVLCGDGGGFGYTDGVPVASVTYICQNVVSGNAPKGEHLILWPSLVAGWVYSVPTGSLSNSDYVYTATKSGSGQAPIVCSYATTSCI